MFIATDGGDARTGECARNYLPGLPYADLEDPGNPGAVGLGNGPGPYYDGEDGSSEDPTDQCGDLPQGVTFYYDLREIDPNTGTTLPGIDPSDTDPTDYDLITIACIDTNDDGTVDVGTCTSWDSDDNTHCEDLYDALPNNKAKCNCERTETNLVTPGFLTVEKVCVPSDDDGTFDLIVTEDGGSPETWLEDAACGDSVTMAVLGDFVVSEQVTSAGDYETPVIGGDCAADGSVTVASEDDLTCTITNTRIICPESLDCSAFDTACGIASCDPEGEPGNCDDLTPVDDGRTCRESAGVCDVAEVCDGLDTECPSDDFVAATTECRASGGVCDVEESCTGTSAACPTDGFVASTTECRASAGVCDVEESCTGTSAACPTDGFVAATTECRASAGVCDVEESCTGTDAACPDDGFVSATTECRAAENECDDAESCTGSSAACPEANETPVCEVTEGCSPGFWRNHQELWDGVGGDDVTSSITVDTTWASLGITSCDGVNLTAGNRNELGETITPTKPSTNTLFHFTACLIGADSIDGYYYQDLNALVAAMDSACEAGGAELEALRQECVAANNDSLETIDCPFDSNF
jgi:hypothetical protein